MGGVGLLAVNVVWSLYSGQYFRSWARETNGSTSGPPSFLQSAHLLKNNLYIKLSTRIKTVLDPYIPADRTNAGTIDLLFA